MVTVDRLSRDLPGGTRVVFGGSSVAFQASISSLVFVLVLGILVAYMVLASQFNSFLHPVTVLTILPLSIAGAAFAMAATGTTLNIFSMIGLLLLLGIVKKNSIILSLLVVPAFYVVAGRMKTRLGRCWGGTSGDATLPGGDKPEIVGH